MARDSEMNNLTRCYVSEQIAKHCNEPEQEVYGCWNCSDEFDNDDELTEVKTKYDGFQFIGPCCIDEYLIEGV